MEKNIQEEHNKTADTFDIKRGAEAVALIGAIAITEEIITSNERISAYAACSDCSNGCNNNCDGCSDNCYTRCTGKYMWSLRGRLCP